MIHSRHHPCGPLLHSPVHPCLSCYWAAQHCTQDSRCGFTSAEQLPCPASNTVPNAAQDITALLCGKDTLRPHGQLGAHQDAQGLYCQAALATSKYWCRGLFLAGARLCSFTFLNFMRFLPQAGPWHRVCQPAVIVKALSQGAKEQSALRHAVQVEGDNSPAHLAEDGGAASGNEAADVRAGYGGTGLEHNLGQHQGSGAQSIREQRAG